VSRSLMYGLFAVIGVDWAAMILLVFVWQFRMFAVAKLAARSTPESRTDDAYLAAVESYKKLNRFVLRMVPVFLVLTLVPMVTIMVLNN
jgi:hypothetical protein